MVELADLPAKRGESHCLLILDLFRRYVSYELASQRIVLARLHDIIAPFVEPVTQ